jgi:sirohydrochlorin cobaltochelatase
MTIKKQGLILFAHGARDVRWARPFVRLQEFIRIRQPDWIIRNAYLEFMSPNLEKAVAEIVEEGGDSITIVPIFFGQGGHVLNDFPVLVQKIKENYMSVEINTVNAVGESDAVLLALTQYCLDSVKKE